MILPKEIKTRHKIRDTKIIQLFLNGKQQHVIAKYFGLTQVRIHQILYANRHLLNLDAKFEKASRVNYLKSQLINNDGSYKSSEADGAQLVDQLRKEFDGDENQKTDIRITNIVKYADPGSSRESILESTSRGTTSDNKTI